MKSEIIENFVNISKKYEQFQTRTSRLELGTSASKAIKIDDEKNLQENLVNYVTIFQIIN